MKYDDIRYQLLKMVCDTLAIRFMCEFYMVGSYLSKSDKEAIDIDIIMVCTEDRAERLFGHAYNWTKRRQNFYFKQKLNIEQSIQDFDIDFKVQTYKQFEKIQKPREKLDSIISEKTYEEVENE